MNPILLLDTTYLCHRAYHAVGDLAFGDKGTGAVFGVLRDIVTLQEEFQTDRCVFAFDAGVGLRYALLPTYKHSRAARHAVDTVEERAARKDFALQVLALRHKHLTEIGFRNVVACQGYEADDIIASIAAAVPGDEEAIIIGSDKDLWQCLRPNVSCWDPQRRKATTAVSFLQQWGLEPARWADVKALAGCSTDDVPGVRGVGELTAARYLRGELGSHLKTAQRIRAARHLYQRNIQIVRLPFAGTPTPELVPDEVTVERWEAVVNGLGMRSLRHTPPRAAEKRSRGRKRDRGSSFGLV